MTSHPQPRPAARRPRRTTALAGAVVITTLLTASAAEAKTVTVTGSKNGGAVTLRKNDRLVVRLSENPSTGYSWRTLSKPSILKAAGSRYVAPPSSGDGPPVVGAPGVRVFTYVARGKGAGLLKLGSKGPTGADGGRFTLRVKVR